MKRLALLLVFVCTSFMPALAQRAQPAPTMLLEPVDWRFERLPIPPGFAREIRDAAHAP